MPKKHYIHCYQVLPNRLRLNVLLTGGVLIGADYSQLELRIIAHLAGDRKLIVIFNSGTDVFRSIAGQLNATEP